MRGSPPLSSRVRCRLSHASHRGSKNILNCGNRILRRYEERIGDVVREIWKYQGHRFNAMNGDHAQLGPTTLSKAMENPFIKQLTYSQFHRFINIGYPYFMLKEVMRSTAGLEAMCSDQCYEGKLRPGPHTTSKSSLEVTGGTFGVNLFSLAAVIGHLF